MLSFVEEFKSSFKSIGLQVAEHKCPIYSPSPLVCLSLSSSPHISVLSEGMEVLGIPIGSDKFVADATLQMAERGKDLCDKLIGFTDLQSSMLLLRHCHVGHLHHLARSIRPSSLSHAASLHNGLTRKLSTVCYAVTVQHQASEIRLYCQSNTEVLG